MGYGKGKSSALSRQIKTQDTRPNAQCQGPKAKLPITDTAICYLITESDSEPQVTSYNFISYMYDKTQDAGRRTQEQEEEAGAREKSRETSKTQEVCKRRTPPAFISIRILN